MLIWIELKYIIIKTLISKALCKIGRKRKSNQDKTKQGTPLLLDPFVNLPQRLKETEQINKIKEKGETFTSYFREM